MLTIGDDAPSFTLPNQHGEPISLSDYTGEYVVIYFYPRADTSGCTTEACGIRDSWDTFRERDITVLGISDDPVADLESFATKYELPFELLSDETGDIASAYESYGEKTSFGNVYDGVFRNTYVIDPDGTIVLAYEGVTPEGHAKELLADIPVES